MQHPAAATITRLSLACALAFGHIAAAAAAQTSATPGPVAVAHVTLAVGEVSVQRPDGSTASLARGDAILQQDRITTGKNGMLMLTFADQGRVAVRPDSELLIHTYTDDPSGANTQLHFELKRGTMRQISGQAAQRQPERYRLNTPIAVIGVRGTDFLANASADSVQTYVHEGAITVQAAAPSLAHTDGLLLSDATNTILGTAGQAHHLHIPAQGTAQIQTVAVQDMERTFGIHLQPLRPATALASNSSRTTVASGQQQTETASATSTATTATLPLQLAWGRYASASDLPLHLPDSLTRLQEGWHTTVAAKNDSYTLLRQGPATLSTSLRGVADFELSIATAYYKTGDQTQPLSIDNPALRVDFDSMRFATSMDLMDKDTPAARLNVSGSVGSDGIFSGSSSQQYVSGALNASGAEAGYLFEINDNQGQYNGITLWTKQ